MSYFNLHKFGEQPKILVKNPFNEEFEEDLLIPPPLTSFMITEVGNNFMQTEDGGSLMITET